MKQIHIGEIIKQRRVELRLTQEELCEGICEPSSLSRIEKGRSTPSHNKLNALLGRLNLPNEKYYALMSEHEIDIEQLKNEIVDCNSRKLYAEGLQKLERLIALVEQDDSLSQQFILRSKMLLGKMENDQIVPYTFEEKLDLLFRAIRLTIPSFDIDKIGRHWYSLDELKIINQIAITYAEELQYEKTAEVFQPLMEYLQRKLVICPENVSIAILVSSNYSNLLCIQKQYEKSIEVAQWGYQKCLEWTRFGSPLGMILYVLGKCAYCCGNLEESKEYFTQSYYIFKVMKNHADTEIMRRNIKKYFNVDI